MRPRVKKYSQITAGALLGVAVVALGVVLLLTQTDWGRRHVLGFGLEQLASRVHGKVNISEVHGNLLSGARLVGVEITDTAGRPFLRADTLELRYSFRSLLRSQLSFSDVRLVNATIVLDQPPGEEWNYKRIFPTGDPAPGRGPGFGDWVQITDMTLRNGTVIVRANREDPDPDSRLWIVPVDGGYQSISEFLRVNARFPFMRLADPDSINRIIEIDTLNMYALPFKPPGVDVRQLSGTAVMTSDSIILNNLRFALPGTRGTGVAAYALNGAGGRVQLTLPTVSLADARFLRPDAPAGSGSTNVAMTSHRGVMRIVASEMDLRAEGATVRGLVDFTTGGASTRLGPSDLRFASLDTRVIRKYAPDVPLTEGTLAGHVKLEGVATSMQLDGDVNFTERGGPTSRILADGVVGDRGATLHARGLRLRFRPLYLSLLRKYEPRVPYRGSVTGVATLTGSMRNGFAVNADLVSNDAAAGRSHILANGRIETANGFRARNLRLRFEPLQMAMIKPFAPTLPYGGTLSGTTTLTGSPRTGFDIIADVVHNSEETGRSHVTANGWVGIVNGLSMRSLRLGFQPLQVAALKPYAPNLPIDGVITGTATVTGSMNSQRIASQIDLEHSGSTGTSHAIGRANLAWGRGGSYDVNVRTPTLSLATVGLFAPAAGLRGNASGTIIARGAESNVRADAQLNFANNGGSIHTRGVFDLTGGLRHYDFTSTVSAFNAAAASSRAPETMLTGVVTAVGSGTDPATANASVNARLFGSRAAGLPLVDTAIVRARVANGLATIDTGHIRLESARGDFAGTFGLVANRSGTLRYTFAIDTLSRFVTIAAPDTVVVRPRPLVQARRLAQAREDSARIARATEVERAATGYPAPPALVPDTVLAIRRDTVRGSLRAEGVLTGNITRFGARGSADARSLAVRGHYVGVGAATYELTDFGTPSATLQLNAFGDTVRLAGFAFDSARVDVNYTGERQQGAGAADLAFYQDPDRDYRVRSNFNLSLEEKRIALQTLTMRFDTTRWTATRPALIGWGRPGVTVDDLEMTSNTGGSLRADGRLPTNGSADMTLDIEGLQLGDITGLLQDTLSIMGIAGLHARISGTTAAPVVTGNLSLRDATYGETELPDIRGRLSYANRDLTSYFELFRDSTLLATAESRLPINLALTGVTGPRLLRGAPIMVDVMADSLPLEALPNLTTVVTDVRGRVRGNATVRGTFDQPRIEGTALLDLGQARIAPTGVLYENITGTIRLRGDTAYVDSIVAHAHGEVRATGTIDFATLVRPGFDLEVAARDAVLVDNERGRIRADADLAVVGPYEDVYVTGDLRVQRSVIYLPETVNRRVTNLEDPTLRSTIDTVGLGLGILPQPNALMRNLRVDVGVTIAPDTWARNLSANVEIYTPEDEPPLRVHMDNEHQVLTLTGIINADRGEYSYAGRTFQLSTGSATFLGGPTLNPFLNLTAQYQVQRRGAEALVIQIHVDGNLTEPRVTLQSNSQPPLSQSDLLSYLAFGQASSSVLSAQTAAFGIGGDGLTGLPALAQQQIASLAIGATIDQAVSEIEQEGTRNGLDVFRVNAGELPAEATFQSTFSNVLSGTEIEAGKYLSDRLFVQAQGRVNTTPGVQLEYRGQLGLTWTGVWEPRFRPSMPSLSATQNSRPRRSLGLLLLWQRRF